jgi:SWI/SNF-related matrix-associated actin-dependent regulator 1 of chromatin subfamily A
VSDIKRPYNTVEIKKLRTNFELRYSFNKALTEYIKGLPRDQQQTKMDVVKKDGSTFEDWYRVVNEAALAKIIDFIKANNLRFKFTNVTDEDVEKLKAEFQQRLLRGEEALKARAKDLDVTGFELENMKVQPYVYQKQAAVFFEKAGGKAILGDSPGVGKTMAAIAYAVKNNLKTLVVCPASLKLNWKNEILRFTNEKAYIYKYKLKKRSKEVLYSKEESLFHIINYEALETFIKLSVSHRCSHYQCDWKETNTKKKYIECPACKKAKTVKSRVVGTVFEDKDGISLEPNSYDLIVCDEAHYLKNPKANRTKVVKKSFSAMPRKLLLTGTAIKSAPYEFFSLLNFVDPAEWKNAHQFGVKYCAGFQDNFGWDYSGSSNLDELYSRISPYFLRRLKSDVLAFLPPKTYTHFLLELSPEEYREYAAIEKKVVSETEEGAPDADHLSRIQKLKMFTSQVKANRGLEIIQNIIDGGEKIVVFAEYISTVEKIAAHFGEQAVVFTGKKNMSEKQEAVDKFMNDDSVKVFVGSIGAAGVGITLTISSTALFIDQPWTPADREQAEDRIHRASTTADKVQIIRMICEETIDEDIIALLNAKEKVTSQVLDAKFIDKKVERVNGSIFRELVETLLRKK